MLTTRIGDCPFGFEDGHIVGYCARRDLIELQYEFWNERHGTLVFERYVGARDLGAIGVEVGSFSETRDSDFVEWLARRHYETRPATLDWKHFMFHGVDGDAIFEVVAAACSYVGDGNRSAP